MKKRRNYLFEAYERKLAKAQPGEIAEFLLSKGDTARDIDAITKETDMILLCKSG